jgi:tetratricopeptide (TPR) repeat protein
MALLIKGELPDLTLDQLKTYLEANHRNAESLLAAYRATHERALLDEALTNFPNDPRVLYTAWFRSQPDPKTPDGLQARRQVLDLLKQAAPDNALVNYLSAANYFKSGQSEQAVQEMLAGAAKPKYDDYVQDEIQRMQEAYLAAGYPEAAAKAAAGAGALLPHLAELKQAGLSLVELANSYQQAGDAASAQAALQMCLDLGQRLDDPNSVTLIQTLVGIAIQRKGLEAMAAAAPDPNTAQAVQEQLTALQQQRTGLRELAAAQSIETWLQTAPPEDVSAYFDRVRIFGEQRALQWLANRQ